jgi:hypothetical protein
MSTPKFPNVTVRLVGENGNAFAILGRVMGAMKAAGVSDEDRQAFEAEATAEDYDQLLRVVMEWVDVE